MNLRTLNGAPLCEHLDFSREALLNSGERDQAFAEFLSGTVTQLSHQSHGEDDTSTHVKWRRLEAASTRLRSGWSQPYLPEGGIYEYDPKFSFSIPNLGHSLNSVEEDSRFSLSETTHTVDEHSTHFDDFLQHSLILHDTLLSSQIALDDGAENTTFLSSFLSTSFDTVTTDTSSLAKGESLSTILQVPSNIAVTSLNSLPSARHLRSIYPQTPTPNLLCVLTSQPEHREVLVRKGGYRMRLYEIVVADDTKSGFKVTFWFRPSKRDDRARDGVQESHWRTLEKARVGDILLLRNIALNIFRDNVYGQSLNSSIARARTSVEVLMRGDGVSVSQLGALPAAVLETFARVKKWAKAHVVPDYANSRKRKADKRHRESSAKRAFARSDQGDETLPPDTMEAC